MKNTHSKIDFRALTLWQPWASFVAAGVKKYETRTWTTKYRGTILIHAARRPVDYLGKELWIEVDPGLQNQLSSDIPLGCVVAIAELTDCLEMVACSKQSSLSSSEILIPEKSQEKRLGLWKPGRIAWKLENVQKLRPVFAKGSQGLWKPSEELVEKCLSQFL